MSLSPDTSPPTPGNDIAQFILSSSGLPPYAQQAASIAMNVMQGNALPEPVSLVKGAASSALASSGPGGQITAMAASALATELSKARAQERGREYEILGEAAPEICPCAQLGTCIPFVPESDELDRLMEMDMASLPNSNMVLPTYAPGSPISQQGMLDVFSRSYPMEAWQLLYILGPAGDGGGLGYRMEFHDSQAEYDRIGGQMEDVRARYGNAVNRANIRDRGAELGALRRAREDGLNDWRFDDENKVLHVYSWAEGDVFGDLWQERELTNQDGADRLRALIAQHFNGEETFWQTTSRVAMGTGLVVFGAIDIFAGVTLATGGTAATGGFGAVLTVGGGLALTAMGADQIAQGTAMLISPDPQDHYGPIGAIINQIGRTTGGESGAAIADRAYMVVQIMTSLGASVQTVRLARGPVTGVQASNIVQETLENAPRVMEAQGLVLRNYPLNSMGQMAHIKPTLSGRGLEMTIDGARFTIREGNNLDELRRVLLRSRTIDNMGARVANAGRRVRMLGAGRMTTAQRRAIAAQAGEYGTNVRTVSNSQFDRLYGQTTSAAFNNQTNTILLRENATHYEALHELQHARHMHAIGPDAYRALGNGQPRMQRYLRERYVYDQLMENSRAMGLTNVQTGHATSYLRDVARRAGIGNDLNLPAGASLRNVEAYRRAARLPSLTTTERQLWQGLFGN